jgi:uncharacterized protein YecT (DUF1311 family)
MFLLLLCGAAWGAAGHPLDAEIEKCMSDDPSTHGTIKCAREGAKKWDAELNRAYRELMGMLPKEGQEALRTAQRAWIPWRDTEFSLLGEVYSTIYNNLDGGTMWLVANAIAEMEVVRTRTIELLRWADTLKTGKPSFPAGYPGKQTDEQLAAAMKVKNETARLGKHIGENGEKIASANLAAWEDFRNKNVLFLAWFYGKKGDRGFPLHGRMLMNTERIKKLEGLYEDLKAGGLEESAPKVAKETAASKEPFKGDRTLYLPEEGTCDFRAYIIDPDPKGTNVRNAPKGKIITTLPYRPDDPEIITVKVTGHKNKWLSVVLHDGRKGWIFGELVGVSLRNYDPGSVTALRTRPDPDAPAVGDIFGDEEVSIIGGEGKWALVQYRHPKGHVLTGWLDPVKQCPNPYSTCP